MVSRVRRLLLVFFFASIITPTHGISCDFNQDFCEAAGFGKVIATNQDRLEQAWRRSTKSDTSFTGPSGPAIKDGVNGENYVYAFHEYPDETAFFSPQIESNGQSDACISFLYNMYAQDITKMGKLYLVVDYYTSAGITPSIQVIDTQNLKLTNERREFLVQAGGTIQQWFFKNMTVSIPPGKTHYRVYFQAVKHPDLQQTMISLDFIDIIPGECSMEGVTDGGWTAWLDYTSCSVTCGWGQNQKTRYCSNPTPVGGRDCLETDSLKRSKSETISNECNTQACAANVIDGGWSAWAVTVECSKSCNGGTETVKRECNFPSPDGGSNCMTENGARDTSETKNQDCNTMACPDSSVNLLNLGAWGEWSPCSETCGFGKSMRKRSCTPEPYCNYFDMETKDCSTGCRTYTCPAVPSPFVYHCNFETKCFQDFSTLGNTEYVSVGTSTPSMATGPTIDVTFPNGCGNFLYYNSISGVSPIYIASPALLAPTGQQCVQFYVNMYSEDTSEIGNMTVYFWQSSSATHFVQQPVWMSTPGLTTTSTSWHKVNIDLNNINNMANYYIFFQVNTTGSPKADVAIDDFSVSNGLCNDKVDGYWGSWGDWESCSETCGAGSKSRSRACDSPAPRNGGNNYCIGDSKETMACTLSPCPSNGNWSEWGIWRECSVSCDNGTRSRERSCSNPSPAAGGQLCQTLDGVYDIKEREVEVCNTDPCHRDGNWGKWSEYAKCSTTCGNGTQTRSRACNSPEPRGNGAFCPLEKMIGIRTHDLVESQSTDCTNNDPCPIHGNWGEWSGFGECNSTCGDAYRTMQRNCSNPEPSNGGDYCRTEIANSDSLIEYKSEKCNVSCCPTNGTWTNWGSWSACSATCDTGIRYRPQICTDSSCGGTHVLCGAVNATKNITEPCDTNYPCNQPGGWGTWVDGNCSIECGEGVRIRMRLCDNPVPRGTGTLCEIFQTGESVLSYNVTETCFVDCNRNGSWGEWENSTCSECNSTSPSALLNQTRECNAPSPYGDGLNCTDTYGNIASVERRYNVPCFVPCPINGNWSEWSNKTGCNATCGGGYYEMHRNCSDPEPQYGGSSCIDMNGNYSLYEIKSLSCNTDVCPVDGEWAAWTQWSTCVGSCGADVNSTRSRSCSLVAPADGGLECLNQDGITRTMGEVDSVSCNLTACPVVPTWGAWTNFTDCSTSCYPGGLRNKSMQCFGGDELCLHPYIPSNYLTFFTTPEICNNVSCAVNGSWGNWTVVPDSCSVTCGNGTQVEFRNCSNPEPFLEGFRCTRENGSVGLEETRNIPCTLTACVVNGTWSNWTDWSNCSESCGSGLTNRSRWCNSPPPSNGGVLCTMLDNSTLGTYESENRTCFVDFCADPYDCSFEENYCNFTVAEFPYNRWLFDSDATHTLGTGPTGPNHGTHYVYFESSELMPPKFDNAAAKFQTYNSSMVMSGLPAPGGDRCITFDYYAHSTLSGDTGTFQVSQISHISPTTTKEISILYVNASTTSGWINHRFQLEETSYPYDIIFFADTSSAGGHGADKAVDHLRFYDMNCTAIDSAITPVP